MEHEVGERQHHTFDSNISWSSITCVPFVNYCKAVTKKCFSFLGLDFTTLTMHLQLVT